MGWFRSVHCKSMSVQEMRAVLSARKAPRCYILETGNDSYRFKGSSEAAQKETKGDDNIDHNMTADKQ